jgi:excisionase family DNA binding protein
VTIREVAAYAGVQVRTVREWIRRGKIKAIKQDNNRLFISFEEARRVTEARQSNGNSN